jgi:GTP pyrophosphokinase
LPKGATSLDFAFSIHSEIGIRTRGTRVNGKLVPLNFIKKSDQIDVITCNIKTTINWLDYVTTSEQNENKNVLNENTKKIGEEGKELDSKIKTFKNNHERTSG